jgi:hypothetical protein
MLDTYIKNRGMTKTIIHNNNRNTINETNWDADYDGDVANVSLDLIKNGRNKHLDFKFTNADLANLLTIPSVNKPIHKRVKMDFKKPKSSFDKIFLELEPDYDSDYSSSSSSSSDDESDSFQNMKTVFDSNTFNNNDKSPIEIQELLTHISSPKSNEEFIMPFQDYSLVNEQPVIKVVHRPNSKSKSSKKSRNSRRLRSRKLSSGRLRSRNPRSMNSRKLRHHNYPSKRKSPRHLTSRRR